MIALEQARQHLETLGIKQAVEVLDNTLDAAAHKQLPYPEMPGVEVTARRECYLTTKTRVAHLPFQRTLEQFDFAFQASIDKRLVKEQPTWPSWPKPPISSCWDHPECGKTHLAVALALKGHRERTRGLLRPRL